ncbi:GNAT family N-acetyltransferase [Geminocystis sp. GBBB08]|uniref:GNAT family N-acetyltransferase n=1 Tax=Geminocystis sp. GBBB08 TaxID=2604140 RepID=UPI0037BF35F9
MHQETNLLSKEQDKFDQYCDHLIIIDKPTGETIGTTRLQTLSMANNGLGFYSQTIFDLSSFPLKFVKGVARVYRLYHL